ncbi:ubiquitination network signaling protein [Cordyceps fumosorosea ARSEF 2679]|uniref:Ubiquitination network signaling protein n=1 Tax=Cordyceps fumosorosea (strain ARSEF 2679) TaxID=1081104 RepID=A0A162JAW7_CORFA|nr:ubiquitination network signaling protein [Cordyceps fumosorosea ARSEF 2679]OAA66272.1 ubiquitination network signaling protein [Cordyceps fumosorosea ARSEF 2679]
MPRASGSGKRQSGGGHRDSRHENGSLASGKRASRKSQAGHVASGAAKPLENGAATTAAAASVPTSSLHNGHANGHATAPADAVDAATTKSPLDASDSPRAMDDKTATAATAAAAPDAARRTSLGAESESSSDVFHNAATHVSNGHANHAHLDAAHRQIDVNCLKVADVHRESGILDMATTVLRALPMQDTLAILILLMHVPTISLLLIYGAFACITFVPPVKTNSGMNLNLAEMFDGNSTTPSLVTVLCMDSFFLLVWLFLWAPIQDAVLDLAKPVIAITLGGATRNDPSFRGIRTGFTWVFLYHIIRGTQSQWGHLVPNMPAAWRKVLSEETPIGYYSKLYDKSSPYAWVRSILAIHILTQSLMRFIREWYLRREKGASSTTLSDAEFAKQHASQLALPDSTVEASANLNDPDAVIANPALPPPPPPPPQLSTAKKRRKQSTQVRLKQPLWAALASTKIVVVKEYELSRAPSESAGANATDVGNLGNNPFGREPRKIWITNVGTDDIHFNTSYFLHTDFGSPPPSAEPTPPGIDITKPFYVKVNNALWQPTRINPVKEGDGAPGDATRWAGDIYGLRPASKYVCEFVDSRTGVVIFSSSLRTIKEVVQSKDGSSPVVSDGSQSLRPDSPVTTLKTSIEAAQEKLSHEKTGLKNLRKECKIRINAYKKENEGTDNQLATAGNGDEKLKQKIRQNEIGRLQAVREVEELADVKRSDSTSELADSKKKAERTFTAEKRTFEAAQKEFTKHRSGLESEVKAKDVERSNLTTRRNKIATRIAKVDNELAHLTDATSRGMNEAERRIQQRHVRRNKYENMLRSWEERVLGVQAKNGDHSSQVIALQEQLEILSNHNDAMMTSWNPNAGAAGLSGGLWPATSADMQPALSGPALHPPTAMWPDAMMTVNGNATTRMRSSSMLSDLSGFTGSSDGSPRTSPFFAYQQQQPIGKAVLGHRGFGANRSNGSGSDGSPI